MTTAWTDRVWREHRAGNLSRAQRDVMLTLRTYRGRGGALWPAHATLAERVRCCVRSVQRALETARSLGLVVWRNRTVRVGWRRLRISNAYTLLAPAAPVEPIERQVKPRVRTTGHFDRQGESKKENKTADERERREMFGRTLDPGWCAVARAALAQRRAQIEARMLMRSGRGAGIGQ